MFYTEKEKDRELAKFYHSIDCWNHHGNITSILLGDGYLEKISPCSGKTTSTIIQITDKGRAFYLNGGYEGAKKMKRTKAINNFARSTLSALIGSTLTILIEHVLLPWLRSRL